MFTHIRNLFLALVLSLFFASETSTIFAEDVSLVYENDVLGVAINYPEGYQIVEDQYLNDFYGFSIVDSEKNPIFDIEWVLNGDSKQQDHFVEQTINNFSTVTITKSPVQVSGQTGVMLSPVPGIEANTLITVSANGRLYTLRYYKGALDDLGWSFVKSVRFYPARQSLDELNLLHADDVLYIPQELENELKPTNLEKLPLPEIVANKNLSSKDQSQSVVSGCTTYSTVQTQWNSGANSSTGVSWAGPSFWGNGSHLDCDSNTSYNDYYALDHALNEWDVIYPHRSGTVIFSGWAGGGWKSLGRMVIIDYGGGYWGVMAHLRNISSLGSLGSQVNVNSIIGYAGGSGYSQDNYYGVHLHQSINKDAVLSTNPGGIYDGQSAQPSGYQYSASGGGTYWYWQMYSGKSMSY